MGGETASRDALRGRISAKQADIDAYLRRNEPRSKRLTNTSIICGGLAGLLTAGPAAGGPSLTGSLTAAIGTSPASAPSWRLLCAAATLCSFVATTALAMYKSQDLESKLAKAQGARARLDALGALLDMTDIAVGRAAEQYTQAIQEVAFISAAGVSAPTRRL
jgi:hypothetical protein